MTVFTRSKTSAMRWSGVAAMAMAYASPAPAQTIAAALAAAPAGTRIGVFAVDDRGREVAAQLPDQRFVPASNTKLFTTAAAYALLSDIDRPDTTGGAGVALEGKDVALFGRGDGRLSGRDDCTEDCLATLADAVARRTHRVRDVIGDDTWFPWQRWSPGMSWNNIGSDDGTAISALTLDDNTLPLSYAPTRPGMAPSAALGAYGALTNAATTQSAGTDRTAIDHPPGTRDYRLYGDLPLTAKPALGKVGVDDPAEAAAFRLAEMLRMRGVKVTGQVRARHRAIEAADGEPRLAPPIAAEPQWLARLTAPPLAADVVLINKNSNNVHAELLLRRLGRIAGGGSLADGLAATQALFDRAGLPRSGYDFSDGSGMSTYNRISPRATVALLRWTQAQPWGAAWLASLPVGGVDGTLKRRFAGTALAGKVWAKTGTLNATNTLSGFVVAASGRRLAFSMLANDVPGDASATPAIDAALLALAAAN